MSAFVPGMDVLANGLWGQTLEIAGGAAQLALGRVIEKNVGGKKKKKKTALVEEAEPAAHVQDRIPEPTGMPWWAWVLIALAAGVGLIVLLRFLR